jgi:phosphate starvation-inducible protein PhoH
MAEKQQKRKNLSLADKLKYLEKQGITCTNTNEVFVNNLYNAVIKMNKMPDMQIATVFTNSQTTIRLMNIATIVDTMMNSMNRRIRGFDTVGGFRTDIDRTVKTLEDHKYFSSKIDELSEEFEKIIDEARQKGYLYQKSTQKEEKSQNIDTLKIQELIKK